NRHAEDEVLVTQEFVPAAPGPVVNRLFDRQPCFFIKPEYIGFVKADGRFGIRRVARAAYPFNVVRQIQRTLTRADQRVGFRVQQEPSDEAPTLFPQHPANLGEIVLYILRQHVGENGAEGDKIERPVREGKPKGDGLLAALWVVVPVVHVDVLKVKVGYVREILRVHQSIPDWTMSKPSYEP